MGQGLTLSEADFEAKDGMRCWTVSIYILLGRPGYCTALTECKHLPDIHLMCNDWMRNVFGYFAMETNLQLTQLEYLQC